MPSFKVDSIEDHLILEKFTEQIDRGLREAKEGKTISSATLRKRAKLHR